ncbi:Ino80c [Scenedesmus sp. PABB004]|nr:Ino80c [Scenedesmus sp. PABB004]
MQPDQHAQQEQQQEPPPGDGAAPAGSEAAATAREQQQQPPPGAGGAAPDGGSAPAPPAPPAYSLDARGKIENYDEADWFVPADPPFKRRAGVAAAMAGPTKPHIWKRVKQLVAAENYAALPADVPTHASLDAPPSMYPAKAYCDITGLAAPYTDPRTRLRYAGADAFRAARSLTADEVQARLAVRGAATVLK